MYQKLSDRVHRDESGFTLVELLVVIVILGILAAIVVFSVRGISDKGQAASCKTDVNMLTTAEEANFAQNGGWADTQDQLKSLGFITTKSAHYEISKVGATATNPYSLVLTPNDSSNPCFVPPPAP